MWCGGESVLLSREEKKPNKIQALRRISRILRAAGFKKKKSFLPLYHELVKGGNSFGVGFELEKGGHGIAADLTLNGRYIGRADELFTDEVIGDNFWKFTTHEELLAQLDEIMSLVLHNYEAILDGNLDLDKRRAEWDRIQEEFLRGLNPEDQGKLEKAIQGKMEEWRRRRAGQPLPLWKDIWEEFGFSAVSGSARK